MGSARDARAGFAPGARAGPISPGNSCAPATLTACWCLICFGGRERQGLGDPAFRFSLAQGGLAAVEDVTGTPLPGMRGDRKCCQPSCAASERPACHLFLQVAQRVPAACPAQSPGPRAHGLQVTRDSPGPGGAGAGVRSGPEPGVPSPRALSQLSLLIDRRLASSLRALLSDAGYLAGAVPLECLMAPV